MLYMKRSLREVTGAMTAQVRYRLAVGDVTGQKGHGYEV